MILKFLYFFIFLFFLLFRATPMAYGGYQARGRIGAAAEAYPTAMATLNLHINIASSAYTAACGNFGSILNPLSEARD